MKRFSLSARSMATQAGHKTTAAATVRRPGEKKARAVGSGMQPVTAVSWRSDRSGAVDQALLECREVRRPPGTIAAA